MNNKDLSETQRPESQSHSQQSQANTMKKATTRATAKNATPRASTSPSTADLSPRERIIAAARHLFGQKGFHNTTTAELATEAAVSTGQIYRHFDAKADIVLAIVEGTVRQRVAEMNAIFDAVEHGNCTLFEAIKAIIDISLAPDDISLSYEITAEAVRNPAVAERLETLVSAYQDGVRRLATLARPDITRDELGAYVDIMMACFIGLGLRTSLRTATDSDTASSRTAALMLRALGLKDDGDTP